LIGGAGLALRPFFVMPADVDLAPGIYCAWTDPPILLDLAIDRYFDLPPAEATALRALALGQRGDEATIERLMQDGVLVQGAGERLRATIVDREASSADLVGRTRGSLPRLIDWLSLWRAHARLRRSLAAGRLASLAGQLVLAKARSRQSGSDRQSALDRYASSRPLIPVPRNCLLDSLALGFWLAAAGHPFTFIIGVRREPFAAHCWLEHGGCVLNDALDNALPFTPVLVL
jgi:hypothetical protein